MCSDWSPTFEAILIVDPLSFTARASLMLLDLAYITGSPCSVDRMGARLVFTTLTSGCHFQVCEICIISSTAAPFQVFDGVLPIEIYCAGDGLIALS